jgi:hypothetical protein
MSMADFDIRGKPIDDELAKIRRDAIKLAKRI